MATERRTFVPFVANLATSKARSGPNVASERSVRSDGLFY